MRGVGSARPVDLLPRLWNRHGAPYQHRIQPSMRRAAARARLPSVSPVARAELAVQVRTLLADLPPSERAALLRLELDHALEVVSAELVEALEPLSRGQRARVMLRAAICYAPRAFAQAELDALLEQAKAP